MKHTIIFFIGLGLLLGSLFSFPRTDSGHCPPGLACSPQDLADDAYTYRIYHCLVPEERNTNGVWQLEHVTNICGDLVDPVYIEKFNSTNWDTVIKGIHDEVALERRQISPDEMSNRQEKLEHFLYQRTLPATQTSYLITLSIAIALIAYLIWAIARHLRSKNKSTVIKL